MTYLSCAIDVDNLVLDLFCLNALMHFSHIGCAWVGENPHRDDMHYDTPGIYWAGLSAENVMSECIQFCFSIVMSVILLERKGSRSQPITNVYMIIFGTASISEDVGHHAVKGKCSGGPIMFMTISPMLDKKECPRHFVFLDY